MKEKKLSAIKNQSKLMKKGFDLGLKGRKVYNKRSEIYD